MLLAGLAASSIGEKRVSRDAELSSDKDKTFAGSTLLERAHDRDSEGHIAVKRTRAGSPACAVPGYVQGRRRPACSA